MGLLGWVVGYVVLVAMFLVQSRQLRRSMDSTDAALALAVDWQNRHALAVPVLSAALSWKWKKIDTDWQADEYDTALANAVTDYELATDPRRLESEVKLREGTRGSICRGPKASKGSAR